MSVSPKPTLSQLKVLKDGLHNASLRPEDNTKIQGLINAATELLKIGISQTLAEEFKLNKLKTKPNHTHEQDYEKELEEIGSAILLVSRIRRDGLTEGSIICDAPHETEDSKDDYEPSEIEQRKPREEEIEEIEENNTSVMDIFAQLFKDKESERQEESKVKTLERKNNTHSRSEITH